VLPQGVLGAFPLTRGIVKHNAFLAKRVTKRRKAVATVNRRKSYRNILFVITF